MWQLHLIRISGNLIFVMVLILREGSEEQSRTQNAVRAVKALDEPQHTKTLRVSHNPERPIWTLLAKPYLRHHRPLKYRRFDRPQPQPADP